MINLKNPNLQIISLAVSELGSLANELVLIGGSAVGLLITDSASPPVRSTMDVDLITSVTPIANYYKLCDELKSLGFNEVDDVICRWEKDSLIIDVLPTNESILGFASQWYEMAFTSATTHQLPNGIQFRMITAPLFLATKIEAFYQRSGGDYGHHDLEDIINLIDGRPELISEVFSSHQSVRDFLTQEFKKLISDENFLNALPWHFHPNLGNDGRMNIVRARIEELATS